MITSSLLEKSRRINHQLQEAGGQQVDFNKHAEVLKELVQANVYIVNHEGKILGYSQLHKVDCDILFDKSADTLSFTEGFCRDFLMKDDQVHINFHPNDGNCVFDQERKCTYSNRYLSIFPIIRGEKRLGTLFLTRFDRPFDVDDLVLLEIGSIGVSLEMLRLNEAEKNKALRQKSEVQLALDTLSYSEYQAVEKIFEELDGDRGLLVASKIADKLGITRSVIVNALRKLESAGVIESNSLGMKGTHIRVLNPWLRECLNKKA
ncbi:MAG: GTP-sensing pleiotropic transcriptional regulator CodY [Firmicutes bacterium]|jgi:transcriptional pleiotropic repressor|nr:GTP-sensing pleiotropic transcriptional regulator CodY [Bacillota bacterium]